MRALGSGITGAHAAREENDMNTFSNILAAVAFVSFVAVTLASLFALAGSITY